MVVSSNIVTRSRLFISLKNEMMGFLAHESETIKIKNPNRRINFFIKFSSDKS
jgi:hypothetical protein